MFCPSRAQGAKSQGSATDAHVNSEENAQGILRDRSPYTEPAKPQFQVGGHQQVIPRVLPREMDLSSFWLTGTLTAVPSPDEISRNYCNMCDLR